MSETVNTLHKSRSYPERLKDLNEREKQRLSNDVVIHVETINTYKQKDQDRTEHFARLGSPSSTNVTIHISWKHRLWRAITKTVDFFLEREEETRIQDEILRKKSYAGFYYFIKWFVRALFFLVFTTLGTIAGKELGCEIKDHHECDADLEKLVDSSPHIIASILGFVCGLFVGQWLGRIIWDRMTMTIRHCLRSIEKRADRTKAWLVCTCALVYVTVTGLFALVFLLFINEQKIIGICIGGAVGMLLAGLAYRKSSSCRSGQPSDTPIVIAVSGDDPYIPNLRV